MSVYAATEKATFAGGCFWCMESVFEQMEGVLSVVSGYTGGTTERPTYTDVSTGETGHYEAIEITFDPERIPYAQLVNVFLRHVDPTDADGQFADRGSQYRTAIFYHSAEQERVARHALAEMDKAGVFDNPIVTEVLPASLFYAAEEYHQNYYKVCPTEYKQYAEGSGRHRFLTRVWGDERVARRKYDEKTGADRKRELTPLQYEVTQHCGTEPPFHNAYWDNHREGIYVDIVSGEVLFSSRDKFDSGTGWPSFTKPISRDAVTEKKDTSHEMIRREVRSKEADSHLGHVFDDGPGDAGLRYCINSAALRFIPKEDLAKEGYGSYKELFE